MSDSVKKLSIASMLTAVGVTCLYFSGLIPSGQIAMVAIAGMFSCAAVIHCGLGYGFIVFAATAILGLLIVPDKGNALFYIAFFGYYPVLKSPIERIKNVWIGWVLKILIVNLAFAILWIIIGPEMFSYGRLLGHAAVSAVLVIFDIGLSNIIATYIRRVATRTRK
jgi:hypothetical protein